MGIGWNPQNIDDNMHKETQMKRIEEIIIAFKKHQLQYGLNGDSGLKELYKWELVTKQHGHPNTDAVDFAKEINSIQLQNLCYPPQITAYRNFAKYEPEEYRMALSMLFTETVDLQERIDTFTSTCKKLWDEKIKEHFEQNTSAMCDERLISCFLTLKYPEKYTFYKNDVYSSLCSLLGVDSKKAGYKLVHFYELLNKYVVPVIEEDKELIDSINQEIDNKGYIHSKLLVAQTVLWYYVCRLSSSKSEVEVDKNDDNNKTNNNPMNKYSEYIELLKENHNIVLTGAPGTGKTFMAHAIAKEMGCGKDEMCFVQFHPSYDYTDFVEGLRPLEKSDGQMGFERKDGVFKEFCKRAAKNIADSEKSVDFVFIIDEINRGEASKIFGELFYAIDPGYRGKTDVRVKTQYQNLIPESDVFADGFYVPDNVYIIGTMNDIDRSVESMDFAMRRRFTWKEVTPADTQSMLDSLPCADEAKKRMNMLNDVIANTDGLGTAYMVGPAYFLKLANNGGDFERLWDMNIEPLLKEYLRGFRKADDILKKFRKAYFKSEETPIEQEVSDELD